MERIAGEPGVGAGAACQLVGVVGSEGLQCDLVERVDHVLHLVGFDARAVRFDFDFDFDFDFEITIFDDLQKNQKIAAKALAKMFERYPPTGS